jgi:hypothetical protein
MKIRCYEVLFALTQALAPLNGAVYPTHAPIRKAVDLREYRLVPSLV